MALEIERKFLVTEPLEVILRQYPDRRRFSVEQCYLPKTGDWTIRARQVKTRPLGGMVRTGYFLTMKRKVSDLSQVEIEYPICRSHYQEIKEQSPYRLEKVRHEIKHNGVVWEIDLFSQAPFVGLVIAEVELKDENQEIEKPSWLGEEVTTDKQYKNVRMARAIKEGV